MENVLNESRTESIELVFVGKNAKFECIMFCFDKLCNDNV